MGKNDENYIMSVCHKHWHCTPLWMREGEGQVAKGTFTYDNKMHSWENDAVLS